MPLAFFNLFPDAVDHIKSIEIIRRYRYRPKNNFAAFFQLPKNDNLGREIYTLRCKFQSFGNTATRIKQGFAERSYWPVCIECSFAEILAFLTVKIKTVSLSVEYLHITVHLKQNLSIVFQGADQNTYTGCRHAGLRRQRDCLTEGISLARPPACCSRPGSGMA